MSWRIEPKTWLSGWHVALFWTIFSHHNVPTKTESVLLYQRLTFFHHRLFEHSHDPSMPRTRQIAPTQSRYSDRNHRISKPPRSGSRATQVSNNNSGQVILGIILSDGHTQSDVYQCSIPACRGKTFGRVTELKRHHASVHGGLVGRKSQFWCPIDGCELASELVPPLWPQTRLQDLEPSSMATLFCNTGATYANHHVH